MARITSPLFVAGILVLLAFPLGSTVISVSSTVDVLADDGVCTLREAVIAANSDLPSGGTAGECLAGSGLDTIVLEAGNYTLTISGTEEDLAATGDLDLTESVNIEGAGQELTIVDGNQLDRVFDTDVWSAILEVGLANLSITNGATDTQGGGIASRENLSLDSVTVRGNSADIGGGIYSFGNLVMTDCLVTDNSALNLGGGIATDLAAELLRIVVSENSADGNGGGIASDGTTALTESTVAFNTAPDGAGLSNSNLLSLDASSIVANEATLNAGGLDNGGGAVDIRNTTFSGNVAANNGGAILTREGGSVDVFNSTLADNMAALGTAIHNLSEVSLTNTLLQGDCGQPLVDSNGGNIESPGSSCGLDQPSDQVDVTAVAVNLGPLNMVNGPTPSHYLHYPSVAIDTGLDAPCLDVDQWGTVRPLDGNLDLIAVCDVGSVESQDLLFVDGFESGDTTGWSDIRP